MLRRSAFAIILLFLALTAWPEINGSFEVGNYLERPEVAFTRVQLEWFIDWVLDFSFYGGWQTWFQHKDGDVRQVPFQDLYTIGARVFWGAWFVGIAHGCLHPVFGGSDYFSLNRADALTYVSAGVHW